MLFCYSVFFPEPQTHPVLERKPGLAPGRRTYSEVVSVHSRGLGLKGLLLSERVNHQSQTSGEGEQAMRVRSCYSAVALVAPSPSQIFG